MGDAKGTKNNWNPEVADRGFGFYEVGEGG
jgi:hypothetical protein